MVVKEYEFERFTLKELQAIVDAHFAGPTAFKDLEESKEMAGLVIYALDKDFCDAALNYLVKNGKTSD